MHKTTKYLGYAGLIPFVSMPILVMIGLVDAYLGYLHFVQYSAIILSFFGGIHWLDAIQNRRKDHQLFVSMLPSIVAWLSLMFLDGTMLLSVLSLSYIGILLYDKYVLALEKDILMDYTKMRMQLTTVVVLSHLFMAYN
ncbi:hypothetical protein GPUN_1080 [Glaciecola punicea ACAM 611]|jgi:hypothetical protein|uniref:DUF3429 domain-containing protein n=1 Tax=Glaciecola punicea ACAM 611 TaxID=1121923 RepID=H5TA84_9ALTE|nr:DUF3429 domain-containing protein [Glaciecola punicea]OFA33486.1 hypothetical protein BAE46_01940 [Glaciecola punicea]GAB55211.1 hypothetical protein GPUN_1080 [Glaciecola punicea ACAM 611]